MDWCGRLNVASVLANSYKQPETWLLYEDLGRSFQYFYINSNFFDNVTAQS
jgi:hypothetical protein